MGYLFIIGLILILATIFAIIQKYEYKHIKKKCDQAIIRATTFVWGEK